MDEKTRSAMLAARVTGGNVRKIAFRHAGSTRDRRKRAKNHVPPCWQGNGRVKGAQEWVEGAQEWVERAQKWVEEAQKWVEEAQEWVKGAQERWERALRGNVKRCGAPV